MDSDAEGVPSEFFDYFKVNGVLCFCRPNLYESGRNLVFVGTYFFCCHSLSGFMHPRFSDMSQTCRAHNSSC